MDLMRHVKKMRSHGVTAMLLLALFGSSSANAQTAGLTINLSPLDGVAITPENLFSYIIQSGLPATEAQVKGTLHYRQSDLSFSYSFRTLIRPGMNQLSAGSVHPQWTFSGTPFRELFMDYHLLPQGTYEYCVEVTPVSPNGELQPAGEAEGCLYQKSEDIFLINLVDPENNAKLYEHYPVFSWIVNYPFASQLNYRIRVAEIREGQNAVGAISRNNPVYTESNLPQTTTTYPVYGRPLETFHDYAWTVDAYYKGILLGGAEPWRFTIVEDSLLNGIPLETSFVDIQKEEGQNFSYAVGNIKLKYVLEDRENDALQMKLFNDEGKLIKLPNSQLSARNGDNRFVVDLKETVSLKHMKSYTLELTNNSGKTFRLSIKYVNPDFFK